MATFDLVGMPFPKTEPLFVEDEALQKKLRQAEDLVEIYHELGAVVRHVDGLLAMQANRSELRPIGIYGLDLEEAIACGCIVGYGKSFFSSSRAMLDAKDVYRGTDLMDAHEFYIALRNKLYAHQEYVGNQHQMFVFQSNADRGPKLNPFGQFNSVIISSGLAWETFKNCLEMCRHHTKSRIETVCASIESSLTKEQVSFIDSCDRTESLHKYWHLSPDNRRDPLESR